jgi:hypothetical protein
VGEHLGVYYYAMQYIQGHGLDLILADLRRLKDGAAHGKLEEQNASLAIARSLLTGWFAEVSRRDEAPSLAHTAANGEQSAADGRGPQPAPLSGSVLSNSTESGYYRAVARVGVQVALALAHALGQGVLHRDIKPSNLLLDVNGHVWVTDFSLAKLEGSEGPTQTGDILGTLRYMAPERFEGWSDRRRDIYGLGMTLYEMLTLRPAFDAATRARLIDQVVHDPPQPPRRVDRSIPRDLETIVLKAIGKEPAERYSTAEALATELENYLADRPIAARRSTLPEQAWRWCRRNKAAAALVGMTCVATVMLLRLGIALSLQSKLQAARTAAEQQRVEADQQRGIAEAALRSERTFLYTNRITFAEKELNDNNVFHAEKLLDECPPERRNWEWNYLKRLCHTDLHSFKAHDGMIYALAVSPDGRLIATGGQDRAVRLWEAETGRLKQKISEHPEGVYSLGRNSRPATPPLSHITWTVPRRLGMPGSLPIVR